MQLVEKISIISVLSLAVILILTLAPISSIVFNSDGNDFSVKMTLNEAKFSVGKIIDKIHTDYYPSQITNLKLGNYNNQLVYEIEVSDMRYGTKRNLRINANDGIVITNSGEPISSFKSSGLNITASKSVAIKQQNASDSLNNNQQTTKQLEQANSVLKKSIAMINNKYPNQLISFKLVNHKGVDLYQFNLKDKSIMVNVADGSIVTTAP